MREKLFALLLSGALALSLPACASGGEDPAPAPTPSPAVETDAAARPIQTAPPSGALGLPPETDAPEIPETPVAEPGDAPLEFSLPRREYQPWQVGYMDFLTALLRAELDTREIEAAYAGLAVDERGVYCLDAGKPLGMTTVMAMGSDTYSLYDVDGDGVPELFVQYGNCEAAYTTQCYTYRDGQVVCIGEFSSGHSSLYSDPDKSAVLRHEGHMGYAELYEYPMEGGRLTEEREIFHEEDVRDYTQTDEIVPGAEYIPYFYTRRGEYDRSYWTGRAPYSAGKALLLPICDYYDGPAVTGESTERARAAILAALNGEREVYGASGDHFDGDIGPAVWEEYVRILTDVPNAQTTAQITAHVWQDLNGDGQEECLLRLKSVTERGKETWSGKELVILSVQDGTVFAYCVDSYDYDREFCTDGAIQSSWRRTALSFWQDQCYEYDAGPGSAAPAVQWLDGSPLD